MDPFQQQDRAFLRRVKTGEQIHINKPIFRLGRERSYVDYYISDNTTVSRSHAQIQWKNGHYVILDTNSVNHTYVNDQRLQPMQDWILRSGDTIRLGNESFEFHCQPASAPVSAVRGAPEMPQTIPADLYRALYDGLEDMRRQIQCPPYPMELINRALHQILLEHPQLCHFEGNWKWDRSVVPTYTLNAGHRRQLARQVSVILRRLSLDSCQSPLEKAKRIYHWLQENVTYDRQASHNQNAYGALVDRKAVCKGIAKAYQLLLMQVGIPCRLVEGTLDGQMNHVWNEFNAGGVWYHSDVTMAYPQFLHIASKGALDYTAVSVQVLLRTHTIFGLKTEQKPPEKKEGFFQSLENQPKAPRHPLGTIPPALTSRLLGNPQFLAAGSVSDVYRFGTAVLKRTPCGEDPAKLYHAMREYAMLQKLTGNSRIARPLAWEVTWEADGYVFYLVQEYVQSMEEYCCRREITPLVAVKLVHSACQAAIQCYQNGIAHMDLQPGNLLVTPTGMVQLTDFSSAVPLGEVSQVKELRGTPAYMAPEVFHQKAYSQAADVYSLGILLYCLLNQGRLPLTDRYTPHEAAQKRIEGHSFRLEGLYPESLRAVVEKACSYQPAQRYKDLQSFSLALTGLLAQLDTRDAFVIPGGDHLIYPPSAPPRPYAAAQRPAPPAASAAAPWAPSFQADTYGASTVLQSPVRPVPPPPPAANSSVFLADNYGSTIAPMPPAARTAPVEDSSVYLPESDASVTLPPKESVRVDKVQFSAVAPQKAVKGEYTLVQLYMYEQAFRYAVDEALEMGEGPMQEKKTGIYQVKENTRVKVVLSSPDVEILDDTAEETWDGGYLCFDFALDIPPDCAKRQILLKAAVYFDGIPATRLMMTMRLQTQHEQRMEVLRSDVLSAFVSYASQDRARVGGLIQGMKKARPDMDIFFDVNSLRSGDDWEQTLRREVERRDILFLCWSKNAKESPWVDMEWRYALENKGLEAIEPIPIDPPDVCPPPAELQSKHFNDSLLYVINASSH